MKRVIAWFAHNGVAANLLMLLLVVAGVLAVGRLEQEVFPEFSLETLQVTVPYPGAAPEEVEDGIIEQIEERVETVDGVKEITSVATEGVGVVTVELLLGTDVGEALEEVKAEIDRIVSFPEEAEEPEVRRLTNRRRVLQVAIYGDADPRTLKRIAYEAEEELTARGDVTDVEVSGVADDEVSIEISRDALRAWGLTLPEVAAIVRQNSLDLPGGTIETDEEEVAVRTLGRAEVRDDFAAIVVRTGGGAPVRLDRIATIEDALADRADLITRFDGQPVAFLDVYRAEGERVLELVEAVETWIDGELRPTLPPGVKVALWQNEAENLESRLELLGRNGLMGLGLVVVLLTLFLEPRVALWVAVGITVAFLGTFAVMGMLGASINMLSLFGFILAIGIVVDDAIVVGENVYAEREADRAAAGDGAGGDGEEAGPDDGDAAPPDEDAHGEGAADRDGGDLRDRDEGDLPTDGDEPEPGEDAAIRGTQRVVVPVIFAVLTTVTAFVPLLAVPGTIGKITRQIPLVVITVLLLSLVESLLILPHHLAGAHLGEAKGRALRLLARVRGAVDNGLRRFVEGPLERLLRFAVREPGITVSAGLAVLLASVGLVAGGWIRFQFLPTIEGEDVIASLEMPPGTTAERTFEVAGWLAEQGLAAVEEVSGDEEPVEHLVTLVGLQPSQQDGPDAADAQLVQPNVAEVTLALLPADDRQVEAATIEEAWRARVGLLPAARSLTFTSELIALGAPVNVQLSAASPDDLERAVRRVKDALVRMPGVRDVRDDRGLGRREMEVRLRPQARVYGLTLESVASQVRGAFFGSEAVRFQRGPEEVRVYVRLPDAERSRIDDLTDLRILTPTGGAVPLELVAEVREGTGPAAIRRKRGRRTVTVTADTDPPVLTGGEASSRLQDGVLAELQEEVPGFRATFGGEQEQQQESLGALANSFGVALVAIYALLAIPFRSYLQPLVIMAAIPFGFVGATLGHLALGLPLTVLSIFGIVGLSGVVINDALVMIDFINEARLEGESMADAIVRGAQSRFRPILLTSLTTFLGIAPIIFETSVQARFLVPMAAALGFGILFATVVLMAIVPALAMLQYRGTVWFQEHVLGRERREIQVVHASHRTEG